MLKDWGIEVKGRIYADSSAALAIASRKGCGKLRHINVGMLWLQEKRAQDIVEFVKVEGSRNPADLMTKHVCPTVTERVCEELGVEFRGGRASAGLQLRHGT